MSRRVKVHPGQGKAAAANRKNAFKVRGFTQELLSRWEEIMAIHGHIPVALISVDTMNPDKGSAVLHTPGKAIDERVILILRHIIKEYGAENRNIISAEENDHMIIRARGKQA